MPPVQVTYAALKASLVANLAFAFDVPKSSVYVWVAKDGRGFYHGGAQIGGYVLDAVPTNLPDRGAAFRVIVLAYAAKMAEHGHAVVERAHTLRSLVEANAQKDFECRSNPATASRSSTSTTPRGGARTRKASTT